MRRSQSRISPLRLPEMSSRKPPRCICTFVIHCLCSRQTLTIEVVGFSRWSKTRTAPSPNPATKILPATWSDVKDVMQEPERAGISYLRDVSVTHHIMACSRNWTYVGADFSCSIPHSDDLDIARNESLALTLLPVQHKSGISIAGK